jgi:hypothetical protein
MDKIDIVWRWCGAPDGNDKDLKYSMRSLTKYASWFNKAFLVVSDNEILPSWLDTHKKLVIIRHGQIIPHDYLPTRNSNVIDSFLHNIPELSEFFIVSDDDTFICQNVSQEWFFDPTTLKPINRHHIGKHRHSLRPHKFLYVKMWQKAIKEYNIKYTRTQHQVQPFRKSIVQLYATTVFKDALEDMVNNRMRAKGDVNVLRFTTGLSSTNGDAIIKFTSEDEEQFYEGEYIDDHLVNKIKSHKPVFLCINNTHPSMCQVYTLLSKLFSRKCIFEK